MSKPILILLSLTVLIWTAPLQVTGRSFPTGESRNTGETSTTPNYCNAEHNIGNIVISVSNDGSFGNGWSLGGTIDCFTGRQAKSCEFPKGSQTTYLWAGDLWIGAIVGRDTLVSTCGMGGHEFHPDEGSLGAMRYRSNIDPARPEYQGAISEQDYIAVYYDTCRNCRGIQNDALDNRGHIPLNIEVTQRSFAWSYSYAEDFILMDYSIKNIGDERLCQVYMGIYVDADVHSLGNISDGYEDDLSGFREYQPALYLPDHCPPDSDQVNIAWTVDNDGGMVPPNVFPPTPHAAATRVVRTPSDSLVVSYNWWVRYPEDYGPQARATYRNLQTSRSEPLGDRNKYHYLSNGEFDYDQHRLAEIDQYDPIWIPPPSDIAGLYATGIDVRYLLSFGPFNVESGQSLPISLAYVCGENFHTNGDNFFNLPDYPDAWYKGVNFDSLGVNATWADWIYDNPGVDTDSDGYAGEYRICNLGGDSTYKCDTTWDSSVIPPVITDETCYWDYENADTIWHKGDGVPDFRGASPPPRPIGIRAEAGVGRIRILWNGIWSENTVDIFSHEIDFEGYRVYVGRDERRSSYSVAASYDIEDFNRWEYNDSTLTFSLNESPFTLAELRCLYAPDTCFDTLWHPDSYPRHHPLVISDDSIYYFEPQDFNQSILANDKVNANTPIKKVYPDAPRPPVLDVDSIRILFDTLLSQDTLPTYTLYLTEDGYIKCFEYEFTLENMLPTVPYWINVTAFDYGSPQSGLTALETSPTIMPVIAYPLDPADPAATGSTEVFVYPNPYILDDDYRSHGFEGFEVREKDDDKVRQILFANLPDTCTIRIYTLDGDLVRELDHPAVVAVSGCCPLTPNEACWDLITRNSQQVVSGLYYWTVEDRQGNIQIGKLAIIL